MLDDTPLSPDLSPIHGIDVRGAIKHKRPGKAVFFRRILYIAGGVAAALVLAAGLRFTYHVPCQVQEKVADQPRYREQLLSSRLQPNTPLLVDAFLRYIPPGPIEIEILAPPSASDAAGFIEQYIKSRRPADWVHVVEARFSDAILLRSVEPPHASLRAPLFHSIDLFLIAGVFIVLCLLLAHLKHRKRRKIIVEAFSKHLATQ